LYAKIENAKVVRATGALVPMLSIDSGNNPQVPVGQPIPNFPGTPNDIYQLNGTLPLVVLSLARRIDECSPQSSNVGTS